MKPELAIQIQVQNMGGEQSKRMQEIVQILKQYQFRQKGAISEDEFVYNLFISLDLTKADEKCTPVFISGMEILKLFYAELFAANRGPPSRSQAIEAIQQLYKNPKQAIQCSFRLLQSKNQPYIAKNDFIDFFINSFNRGIDAILKHQRFDAEFKNNFKEWIKINKETLVTSAERMFAENAQSISHLWMQGDFKRWIRNKSNWNIFVKIRGTSYNIPLNLPSLFSIRLQQSSS